MKILVTGGAGQLGRELKRSLACLGEVVACDRRQIDFADPGALRAAVRAIAPAAIVNAAAYTAVDKAETEAALAQSINATAPGILAEEAQRLGARADPLLDRLCLRRQKVPAPTPRTTVRRRFPPTGAASLMASGRSPPPGPAIRFSAPAGCMACMARTS